MPGSFGDISDYARSEVYEGNLGVPVRAPLDRMKPCRYVLYPPDKDVRKPLYIVYNFNCVETFHDFLPENTKLHLGQAIAHASMHTKSKCHMCTGIGAINDEFFWRLPADYFGYHIRDQRWVFA